MESIELQDISSFQNADRISPSHVPNPFVDPAHAALAIHFPSPSSITSPPPNTFTPGRGISTLPSFGSEVRAWGNSEAQRNTDNTANTVAETSSKLANSLFNGASYGVLGSAIGAIPDLVKAGLNYDIAGRNIDLQRELGEGQLSLENRKFDAEWNAASRAGLLSPSQLNNVATGTFFRNTGSTAFAGRRQYTGSNSNFS